MMRKTRSESNTCSAETLRNCLEYLYQEAMNAGFRLPAHFIGVAAEAAADLIEEDPDNGGKPAPLGDAPYTPNFARKPVKPF